MQILAFCHESALRSPFGHSDRIQSNPIPDFPKSTARQLPAPSLWRAVDHEGEVQSYITGTLDKSAALRCMKETLKRHGLPVAITMNGLRSYEAAMFELGNLREARDWPPGEQQGRVWNLALSGAPSRPRT